MALIDEANRIRDLLVENYQPMRVILFGSTASGKGDEESDIDLLVIKETSERFVERRTNARRAIRERDRKVPVDLIVLTPRELEARVKKGDLFIIDILENGRTLYAA